MHQRVLFKAKLASERIVLEGKEDKGQRWGRSAPGWASSRSTLEGQAEEKMLTLKIHFFVLNHTTEDGMTGEPREANPS